MITDWSILSSRDDTELVLRNDSWLLQRSCCITHLKESLMMSSGVQQQTTCRTETMAPRESMSRDAILSSDGNT